PSALASRVLLSPGSVAGVAGKGGACRRPLPAGHGFLVPASLAGGSSGFLQGGELCRMVAAPSASVVRSIVGPAVDGPPQARSKSPTRRPFTLPVLSATDFPATKIDSQLGQVRRCPMLASGTENL